MNNTNSDTDYDFYYSSEWANEICQVRWLRNAESDDYDEFMRSCLEMTTNSSTIDSSSWLDGFKEWIQNFIASNHSVRAIEMVSSYMNNTSKAELMLDVTEAVLDMASEATHWTPSLPDDSTTPPPDSSSTPPPSTKGGDVTYPVLVALGAASWLIPIGYFIIKKIRGKKN